MAKKMKKLFAVLVAICICTSMIPQALAAEIETETVVNGGLTTTITTTTDTTVEGGKTTVTTTVEKNTTGEQDGVVVERNEFSSTTDTTEVTPAGTTTGHSWVESGNEKTTETKPVVDVTVKIPGTNVDDPNTEENETVNKVVTTGPVDEETVIDGEKPADENAGEYDYTSTTVQQQGNVTVTTTGVKIEETILDKVVDENGNVIEGTDLDYFVSQAKPVKGENANDLFIWVFRGNRTELPEAGEEIELEDGFEYKYLGAGNTSHYLPAFMYDYPDPENPDEEPAYIDENGNKYYIHGRDGGANNYFGDIYLNGEASDVEGDLKTIFSVPQQFILVDGATGELITTYCADADTPTEKSFNYNIENLEDADYYKEEQAAMIRTIAKNGYWGTASGETGSIDSMKDMMRSARDENGNPVFTQEEVDALTDGIALSATQMAIWSFSNAHSGMKFVNAHYTKNSNADGEIKTNWAGTLLGHTPANTPADKKEGVDLLMKLYNFMINMDPTPAADPEIGPTTADTIINADNFLGDTAITVLGKAEDHEYNKDEDDANDAYVVDLSFALVVKPLEDNKDELVVTVIGPEGPIAVGRIAGEAKEGEILLSPDGNGNYCFKNLCITEGDQSIKLSLTGLQNLTEGVYLYSSEVRTDEEGTETSSQTMVGMAGGKHAVNVSMEIDFNVAVDESIIVTERKWRNEGDPVTEFTPVNPPRRPTPPTETEEIPEEDPPLAALSDDGEVILDEEVPLANVPKTGDNSVLWLFVSAAVVLGLVFVNLSNKKRTEA